MNEGDAASWKSQYLIEARTPSGLNLTGWMKFQTDLETAFKQYDAPGDVRGLYPAPQIPARIRWNDRIPAELYLAEGPAKFVIPGTTYSGGIEPFRN